MPSLAPVSGASLSTAGDDAPDLIDGLSLTTGLIPRLALNLSQSMNATGTPSSNVAVLLADALTTTSDFTPEVLANLIERLHAAASPSYSAVLQGTASDRVSFLDSVMSAWALLLSEEIATTGAAIGSVQKLAALIDALAATGQANGQLSAFAACSAAMALEGLIAQGFNADVADAAIMADTSAAIARLIGPLVEALNVSDTGTPMLRMSAISAETLTLDDDLASIWRGNADLADGLLFYVSLRISDTDYSGWALNTSNLAASEYRSFPFDSFASFKGKHYAAGQGGIVRLGGDTDDGAQIDAWLRTTLTHFGTNKWKRVPDAYIGCTASGDMVLKTITRDPGTGEQFIDWYAVVRRQELGPGQGRVQIGRGLRSTWWGFELHNKAGADFDIDSIELRPLILDRRT